MFLRERLLRFARNDNAPYVIKGIACVIARIFSEAISRFRNGELVAACCIMGYRDVAFFARKVWISALIA
ncbi:MAG: hypothetical protein AYP45_11685 [Candidatus Brocadia carolinensis]|uniref:Uncharacterized protein n=1 Tax=Candidatus Brocadia carolinensis TaxID=1004156 RepID=A0A1V4AS54_9BACT|nr:MAG: hypothetical protein AYP45_11685 [Candidatus Brocadia caroliniensis]